MNLLKIFGVIIGFCVLLDFICWNPSEFNVIFGILISIWAQTQSTIKEIMEE